MKDHSFNARNDEQRARRTKANEPATDYKVDDSPAMQKKAARQRAKGIAATADAQPGSIAALADATDLAIRAASPAPKEKHPDDVTAKVAKDMKRALAAQASEPAKTKDTAPEATVADGAKAMSELFDRAEREGKPVAKKKVASLAKSIDAAIAADTAAPATKPARKTMASVLKRINAVLAAKSNAPIAATTKAPDDAAAPAATKPTKVDWLDNGLERTGALTVDALARAWIAHLEDGGKTTASTIASYANDLKTAIAFFGADKPVAEINAAYLSEFNISDGVIKLKSGAPKAQPTILKMRRAFRMAVEWARENSVQ